MAGRGCVFRRKGRRGFSVRFTVSGRTRWKGGFSTATNARRWLDNHVTAAERDLAMGLEPLVDNVTFAKFVPHWREMARQRLSPTTYAGYTALLDNVILPHFGRMPVALIARGHVERFLLEVGRRPIKAVTLNRYLTLLSTILRAAVHLGFARENPCRSVRRAREVVRPYPYLTSEDELRLLAALPAWLRVAALISLDAGLRLGEILALTPRDVDLARRVLIVRRSKNGLPREVGINRRLHEGLARHLATLPAGADRLVLTSLGRPPIPATFSQYFRGVREAIDVPGLRFHDLRHMHGTRLAERGAPPAVIKAALGHKCLAATLRYIDHAPTAIARNAAFLLDSPAVPAGGAPPVRPRSVEDVPPSADALSLGSGA